MTPEQHFQDAFRADFDLIWQLQKSRLFQAVRVERQDVENEFYNYIGALDDDDDVQTTRHGDTTWSEIAHMRRRVTLFAKDKALALDKHDKKMMGPYDPSNAYVQALTAYFGRYIDRQILRAAGGPAYTGRDGSTVVNNYDVGECRLMEGDGTWVTAGSGFSGSTDTVLTPEKLNAIGGMMTDNNVPDDGQRYMVVNDNQIAGMMTDNTWDGEEIKAIRDIRTRNIGMLLGFNFIVLPSKQFTVNATDTTCIECYAWHRDAMLLATGSGSWAPEIKITERNDKKHTKQIFCQLFSGATRLQGPGVVQVLLKKVA